MSNVKVWLDNYPGQYFPGSPIQGKFIVNLDSETTLRAVKLRIKGSEHTEWMGQEQRVDPATNSTKVDSVVYIGDNDFLFHEIILYGSATGSTSLAAGQHIYPFSFTLPHNLPSTFNCPRGAIAYKCLGVVDRPMRTDLEDQFMFVVFAPIDLNRVEQSPDLMGPSSYSDEKSVCCFCCASGPISMDIQLPKRAAIPGETIPIKIRVSNQSNVNVESVKVTLKQRVSFLTNSPSSDEQEDNNVIATQVDVGVGAHGENTFTLPIQIPNELFLPNFDQCKLFKATYVYEARSCLPSYHGDLVVNMYPIIGNIPPGGQASLPPPTAPDAQNGPPPNQGYPVPGGYPAVPPQGQPGGYPSPQGPPPGAFSPQGPPPAGYPQGPPPGTYPAGPPAAAYPGYPAPGTQGPPPGNMGFVPTSPAGYPVLPPPNTPVQPNPPGQNGINSKAHEASFPTGGNANGTPEDPPPSYDMVKPQ